MNVRTALIGADWGTSNLRVFRFDAAGAVIEQREAPCGIGAIRDGAFESALMAQIASWLPKDGPPPPIVLCGMIGSQQGWAEAAYVPCPADTALLARRLLPLATAAGPAWIVPGLSLTRPDGLHDVMRGEETQILGALDAHISGLVITPGTHSKWVRVAGGRIETFRTFMSGEVFAILCAHSILGRLMQGREPDEAAFRLGVSRALEDPALLSLLFSARAEGLFGALPPTAISAYLSGLLIGSEVRSGLPLAGAGDPITIIGSAQIAGLYQTALAEAGLGTARIIDGADASARGLFRIGAALNQELSL
ncbi:MAG: 2-dehydro-3-deoxygalactonokinase [Caulobacteraceae bacterium]|nr:2-dehydro-3-deoxygalactonokinase [Caulobacteraceae bacterium]